MSVAERSRAEARLLRLVVSPDGRQVAFSYVRWVASLAILRGLER